MVTFTGPVNIGNPAAGDNTMTTWGSPVDAGRSPFELSYGWHDPMRVWRSQPSVRKVVGFIARNVASVPWHAYSRESDTDRRRVAGSPAERVLHNPARFITGFRMWHDVAVDYCLYDRWLVIIAGENLVRIPPRMIRTEHDAYGNTTRIGVATPTGVVDITDAPIATSSGWSFTGNGVSPMHTLRGILEEQSRAVEWRSAMWQNSPKMSGFLKRPIDAAKWAPEARSRFVEGWRKWRDTEMGGTPILEDGMTYEQPTMVTPADAKDIEGRQLTDAEVASAFHVPPELVGARQGTFSNIAAFRQMLFGPTLGPMLEEFQQAVNAELVPALDSTAGVYVELDREAAMNGSFAEQAQILSTSIGGPWLTRNEGRAKQNLPSVDGGDELITPLNVLTGGQASPRDTGAQNIRLGKSVAKADEPSPADRLRAEIDRVYRRQVADLDTGQRVDPAKFHDAWDQVMKDAIHAHLLDAASGAARDVLAALKAAPDVWSLGRMRGYVEKMAETISARINDGASAAINGEWPADPDHPDDGPSKTGLLGALSVTAGVWAATSLTNAAGFGGSDGARAAGAGQKTWVTGPHARPSHQQMNGETVAASEPFSNGLMWPGDSSGPADETAGCNCGLAYSW